MIVVIYVKPENHANKILRKMNKSDVVVFKLWDVERQRCNMIVVLLCEILLCKCARLHVSHRLMYDMIFWFRGRRRKLHLS